MKEHNVTIGMDISDKKNQVCMLNQYGEVIETCQVPNTVKGIEKYFGKYPDAQVIIEAGTHSPWISRTLITIGCKVLVGNPRKLRFIWQSDKKDDIRDAEMLARVGRFDPNLLYPVQHRGEQAQADLALIKARDILVQTRSGLINHVRGAVKSVGARIVKCSAASFHKRAMENLPAVLQPALLSIVSQIEELTRNIRNFERAIDAISKERYPETGCLQRVGGVGPITSLAFILTLEEPTRFNKSREVGPFLGLTPRRDQSGEQDKQLRITKAGNTYLRKLLVGSAHYILGAFGKECDLRSYGLNIARQGGKNAKRRAVVAVARKLAVLLHRLWITGEVYDPFHNQRGRMKQAA